MNTTTSLLEILKSAYVGIPETSWENILTNIVDEFKLYCDDEASGFLMDKYISGEISGEEMLNAFEDYITFGVEDINDYDVIY